MEPGSEFDSFDEFVEALDNYCKYSNVVYCKTDSKRVEAINKTVKKPFDDKFKFKYVKYECKNGSKNKRKKTKGRGLRPNQRTFDIGCLATLTASINKDSNKFVVQVHNEVHNHDLSEELIQQYRVQRRDTSDDLAQAAQTMLKMGAKVKVLQEFLKTEKQHLITVQDVHNMRQKMKTGSTGGHPGEEILLKDLEEIMNGDQHASVSIKSDDSGTLQALLLVTGHMKTTFNKFTEVLFVDGTYCTNKLRLPLYTFVVEDGNGHDQSVGYCFVSDEKICTIQFAISEFGKCVDLGKVQVVVVDKDLNEIASIQTTMPGVSIQICKFHVIQAITREVRKVKVTEEKRRQMIACFFRLVYAQTEKAFDEMLAYLSRISTPEFMAYYSKTWHHLQQFWAVYLTNNHTNLGNTTNNRAESHNDNIKDILTRNMSISEAVRGLMLLHKAEVISMAHENIFHEDDVAERCLQQTLSRKRPTSVTLGQTIPSKEVPTSKRQKQKQRATTRTEMFKEAISEFKIMADFMSQQSMTDFNEKMDTVKKLCNIWLQGEHAVVVGSADMDTCCELDNGASGDPVTLMRKMEKS